MIVSAAVVLTAANLTADTDAYVPQGIQTAERFIRWLSELSHCGGRRQMKRVPRHTSHSARIAIATFITQQLR